VSPLKKLGVNLIENHQMEVKLYQSAFCTATVDSAEHGGKSEQWLLKHAHEVDSALQQQRVVLLGHSAQQALAAPRTSHGFACTLGAEKYHSLLVIGCGCVGRGHDLASQSCYFCLLPGKRLAYTGASGVKLALAHSLTMLVGESQRPATWYLPNLFTVLATLDHTR
jgi:hypothetical protein